ncbi:hypothetical protein [Enterovirga rhinocerotis]|uniref:Lipoprotein n=1 Tax=Enterovirga rhinocerotis TaxID=1339210 RepID=A0A4R7C910_9HYPH|nr:hypothetical protein [Enterovirga rhinocerotis]TDR94773.1 hypothetical protein EV668_2062 [Enterovirga rhinocerotis]
MVIRGLAVAAMAAGVVACSPSGGGTSRANVTVKEVMAPGGAGALATIDEARTLASGHSFLRPSTGGGYEVLYFAPGGKVSLLRSQQSQIVHGQWAAEATPVSSSATPVPSICISLDAAQAGYSRRCIDPRLLKAPNTERARGDVLGIASWQSVPASLPREQASLADLRRRVKG